MNPILIYVSGKPKPAGSKRAFVLKKGGVYTGKAIVTDACATSRDWKIDVQHAARDAYKGNPLEGPLKLVLCFLLERPKSHYRTGRNAHLLRLEAPPYPASKPDATKLCRAVEDALTGIVWKDDAQIVTQKISKRYSGSAGVQIEIHEETP